MKAMTPATTVDVAERPIWSLLSDLVKLRLTLLVLFTAFVGFYLGSSNTIDYWLLFHSMMGTGMLAAGAAALNQFLERNHDAKMRRTESRPLPSGRLRPESVLVFGGFTSAV